MDSKPVRPAITKIISSGKQRASNKKNSHGNAPKLLTNAPDTGDHAPSYTVFRDLTKEQKTDTITAFFYQVAIAHKSKQAKQAFFMHPDKVLPPVSQLYRK